MGRRTMTELERFDRELGYRRRLRVSRAKRLWRRVKRAAPILILIAVVALALLFLWHFMLWESEQLKKQSSDMRGGAKVVPNFS